MEILKAILNGFLSLMNGNFLPIGRLQIIWAVAAWGLLCIYIYRGMAHFFTWWDGIVRWMNYVIWG